MSAREKAISIVQRLRQQGYEAYFAGGCVRDMLLNKTPQDYDITTSARPEDVQRLFPDTIPVGAQFGVILVLVDGQRVRHIVQLGHRLPLELSDVHEAIVRGEGARRSACTPGGSDGAIDERRRDPRHTGRWASRRRIPCGMGS